MIYLLLEAGHIFIIHHKRSIRVLLLQVKQIILTVDNHFIKESEQVHLLVLAHFGVHSFLLEEVEDLWPHVVHEPAKELSGFVEVKIFIELIKLILEFLRQLIKVIFGLNIVCSEFFDVI